MGKGEEIPKTNPAEIEKLIEQIRGTNLEPGAKEKIERLCRGEFSFSGVLLPAGRYRPIASSKAFKDLNILIELKQTPDTDPEKRNRILLHMKLKSYRGSTYATLISEKEYQDRERQ